MNIKLFDSELKVMEALWKEGDLTAGQLAKILKEQTDWNRNTTYTVIKKLLDKGVIERIDPNFICHALISKEQAQALEVDELIDKMFGGSTDLLFAALLDRENISGETMERLLEKVNQDGRG